MTRLSPELLEFLSKSHQNRSSVLRLVSDWLYQLAVTAQKKENKRMKRGYPAVGCYSAGDNETNQISNSGQGKHLPVLFDLL